ncbi:MAG: high-potential iron-sulfur protein [Deltaproteobacteria bacterium]|nr:high-potential iron-sulfur protein [Deltaproteobacteria bacterium]MBW2359418.1 high-potential iron-sulfur protein [Deltaproteobacteria bacterium]
MKDSKKSMDRREFLAAGLTTAALLPGALLTAKTAQASEKLVTALPGAAPMVTALQYVDESAKADQNCSNCQLYVAGQEGTGKCQIFPMGVVKETGYCVSWALKVA